ncbi:MAG: bifunctional folylpolyglutamate synthase/dihydrofolate synthase [Rikenellaceae bacterium]|nr:bifunctional folylpolyglutamate synthase/dihydrofolate synthase [Rikenellaceae bacterium]
MNYTETLDYLFTSLPTFQQDGALAYKPGLERVSEFCRKIGNPQRSYFVIHVAGTNGKGSVSNMLASVLQQAGYQVGLYTSPHLTDFRERIRINGEMISKQKVVNFVSKYRKDMEECELSFFEMTTAMAFDYFAQNDVEVAVIETGLGGRLDATNIVIPAVSVITNVGLEHTDLLGDSLPKIAREKGGIIKKSIPVVVGEKSSAYNLVIEDIAADRHSTVIYAEQAFECHRQQHEGAVQVFDMIRTRDNQQYTLRIPLLGEYQRQNVATVCAVADYLHENTPLSISRRAFVEGLRDTTLITGFRGRWQRLSTAPTIICDTAHNAHGIRLVAKQLEEIKEGKLYCVMGFCEDKNITEMLALMPKGAHYIFTRAESRRAATVEHISAIASALNLDFEFQPTVATAVERAKSLASGDDTIFIGGSTFVVAEILP